MTRRSWIAQSAHRSGAGPHADGRERRACSTRRQCRDRAVAEDLDTLDVEAQVQRRANDREIWYVGQWWPMDAFVERFPKAAVWLGVVAE